MANYSLLLALTGFRDSAVDRCLWLDPKVNHDNLRTFFSTDGAWGTLHLRKTQARIPFFSHRRTGLPGPSESSRPAGSATGETITSCPSIKTPSRHARTAIDEKRDA